MDMPPQLTLADNDYHLSHPNEEDLPPPPSPVSSSYSELRRATDNSYPTMPTYPSQNYQHLNNANILGHHGSGGAIGRNDLMQQTYANSYQPDYGTYVPSSQVNFLT